jgi:hypothetical protein
MKPRLALPIAALATICAPPSGIAAQTQPAAARLPSCFNFSEVADYRTASPQHIRVTTRKSGNFDLELIGPACEGTTLLAIQRAPTADICIGRQVSDRLITFRRDGQPPITCKIGRVGRAQFPPKDKDRSDPR